MEKKNLNFQDRFKNKHTKMDKKGYLGIVASSNKPIKKHRFSAVEYEKDY